MKRIINQFQLNNNESLIFLAFVVFAISIVLSQFFISWEIFILILGTIAVCTIGIILSSLKLFKLLFLAVTIGIFQAIPSLFVNLPFQLGGAKYIFIFWGIIFLILGLLNGSIRSGRNLKIYVMLCLVYFMFLFWMYLSSHANISDIRNSLSLWATFNIPVVFLAYFGIKNTSLVYRFLRILVSLGVVAAVIGILEYLLGPARLVGLGVNVYEMKYAFASSNFRVFSIFPSHYELASFMVICLLAEIVLIFHEKQKIRIKSILVMSLLLLGLLLTFNITLWFTFFACLLTYLLLSLGGLRRIFRNKFVIRTMILALMLVIISFSTIPVLRQRFFSLFQYQNAAAGTAGKSLFWRTVIFKNSLTLIREHPFGVGPEITKFVQDLRNHGWLLVTSDVYLNWLMLMGGIHLAILFLLLIIFPLWSFFKNRSRVETVDKPLCWGIWSLLFVGVLVGSLSNSALINSAPTNLLIWSGVGILLNVSDEIGTRGLS